MQGLGYDMNAISHPGRNVDGSVGVNVIRPNSRNINGWPRSQTPGREPGRRMDRGEDNRRLSGAEVAMQRSESAGWAAGMLQSVSEHQEMERGSTDLELDQLERRGRFFIDLGIDAGASGAAHSPHAIPNTVLPSDVHPAYRDTVDSTF